MKRKRQVVVIHGGSSFKKYADYLRFLKSSKVVKEKLKPRKGWKLTLESQLGKSFDVLQPRMPNANNAKYAEWQLWFNKIIPFLRDGVILVGHSLGGLFLAKYLSENKFPKKIKAVFLIAAPHSRPAGKENPADFAVLRSLKRFDQQCPRILIFQSKDDPLVPVGEALRFHKELQHSEVRLFTKKGHFRQQSFPELVRTIRKFFISA